MCLTCGCRQPSNRHGNADNITAGDLKRAAKTRVGPGSHRAAARNLHRTVKARRRSK